MKIYTKTGDKGQTSLANGKRVSKTDLRLECYGTADELNSWVGLLRARTNNYQEQLDRIQNLLFNLGARLADAPGEDWITTQDVTDLELWIDQIQEQLEPLRAFILPAGNETIATCHLCRTVTRRLERLMVNLLAQNTNDITLQWVNRLSDFWFVLARKIAKDDKISLFLWKK
ncbi:MAG: cob(I)yrinic acid a,c-diamide adenosyltransferase [Paludibacteraceae bacterium]|nr:cob(I)yrinic acid a,c-diamide adenosyltransferase [Paludibacteraceae bacterium]MBR1516408.1 cob(I)yrinic acid a,c-diamide adenosyltransferase [Paludibacteraceae bacterium]